LKIHSYTPDGRRAKAKKLRFTSTKPTTPLEGNFPAAPHDETGAGLDDVPEKYVLNDNEGYERRKRAEIPSVRFLRNSN